MSSCFILKYESVLGGSRELFLVETSIISRESFSSCDIFEVIFVMNSGPEVLFLRILEEDL